MFLLEQLAPVIHVETFQNSSQTELLELWLDSHHNQKKLELLSSLVSNI
jgi:hypothetical protein